MINKNIKPMNESRGTHVPHSIIQPPHREHEPEKEMTTYNLLILDKAIQHHYETTAVVRPTQEAVETALRNITIELQDLKQQNAELLITLENIKDRLKSEDGTREGMSMTDEQINIAIAEHCGWKCILRPGDDDYLALSTENLMRVNGKTCGWRNVEGFREPLPDYRNDLNAMHDAEKRLNTRALWETYKEHMLNWMTEPVCATARQRSEAFLRTVGKWVEHDITDATIGGLEVRNKILNDRLNETLGLLERLFQCFEPGCYDEDLLYKEAKDFITKSKEEQQ